MPELSDVAIFQGYFDSTCRNQKLAKIQCHEPSVLANSSPGSPVRHARAAAGRSNALKSMDERAITASCLQMPY